MIYPDLPERALSIMNPWAFLIVNGKKDIENRNWQTKFRGPVAIHAGQKSDRGAMTAMHRGDHPVVGGPYFYGWPKPETLYDLIGGKFNGGIIGVAEIVDCVEQSDSEWFVGRYGFVLANARPVSFIPCPGALGFFNWRNQLQKAKEREAVNGSAA